MTSTTTGPGNTTGSDASLQHQTDATAAPLQDAAGEIAGQAGRTAEAKASVAMTQVGDALDQVARAARDAAASLRQDRPEFAGVVETAATKAEEASTYLRQHDAREVIASAEDVARRQPALVIAGGLALGLVVGRLLRSAGSPSTGDASRPTRSDWYDVGAGSSGSSANLGTRPYSMGSTVAGGSQPGTGNGAGAEGSYRLAESGE